MDGQTGLPIAKLLDFGLSKHAGLGSAAKTFVGALYGVCVFVLGGGELARMIGSLSIYIVRERDGQI